MDYIILPPEEILEATVALPLSKSISNRALVIDALTVGAVAPPAVAQCDDTEAVARALASPHGEINLGAAGTAMRFLTAYFASLPGAKVTLTGSERLLQRPVGPLVEALRSMGAEIRCLGCEGYPPLAIEGRTLSGGDITVKAGESSQYLSAILMVAPTMERPLRLRFEGEPASLPYLRMTVGMMQRRGIDIELTRDGVDVAAGSYRPLSEPVERDWSAASYWYEIAALTAGWVTLEGLSLPSLQGDCRLAELFPRLGVLTEITEAGAELSATPDLYSRFDVDMTDIPDLVPAFAVTAAMLGVPFRMTGVASLRIKECDRLEALRRELDKFGIVAEIEGDNVFAWDGTRHPIVARPEIDTYSDHRIAMAFAPAACMVPGMVVRDIEVVTKSYPSFWNDLTAAGFRLVDAARADELTEVE